MKYCDVPTQEKNQITVAYECTDIWVLFPSRWVSDLGLAIIQPELIRSGTRGHNDLFWVYVYYRKNNYLKKPDFVDFNFCANEDICTTLLTSFL